MFEPENAGRSLTLIPEEAKEQPQLPRQMSIESLEEKAVESPQEATTDSDRSVSSSVEIPKRNLRDREKLKLPSRLIELLLTEVDEPRDYSEANRSPDRYFWLSAMEEEMKSLKENSTWTLMNLPLSRNPISNR